MLSANAFWEPFLTLSDPQLLYQSRVHRLPSCDTRQARIWVKREDESGFGISGCKKRKFASLLPYLKLQKISTVGLIGGARSNHVVGLLQLLREARLSVRLFLREDHAPARGGNAFLMRLLRREEEIQWISKAQWPEVGSIAQDWLDQQTERNYLVPEGGFCAPALPGLATLLYDIEGNEQELSFSHIFVDSGTGFTAATLLLLNAMRKRKTQIQVVRTAGSEAFLHAQVGTTSQWLTQLTGQAISVPDLRTYPSCTARAFGSVNRTVKATVERFAREEGVLCDPIYTAKLFLTAEQEVKAQALQGDVLWIHGGGGTGLLGFGENW